MTLRDAPRAETFALWCLRQAVWPPVVLTTVAAIAWAVFPGEPTAVPRIAALLALAVATLATLGLSVLILFDALLFRLIASYEDEDKGGAAVDDILTRMRLKPRPTVTRSLAERAAGTRRLVLKQRVALVLALASAACAVLA